MINSIKYVPFLSEYSIMKTVYNILTKRNQSIVIPNKDNYRIHNVLHYQIKVKEGNYIISLLYNIMKLLFDTYDHTHYNIRFPLVFKNPNKINNVGFIDLTIEKNDTVNIIENKLTNGKVMAFGSYFLANTITQSKDEQNKKNNIDIVFSSLPICKSKDIENISKGSNSS